MRLWSIHPRYLDAKGLVALWREGLLAQKVLVGDTRGYQHHPQLLRFKALRNPVAGIRRYLHFVHVEALERKYSFDRTKIGITRSRARIDVATGQLAFEMQHLQRKLQARDPDRFAANVTLDSLDVHPMFNVVEGDIADWEVL